MEYTYAALLLNEAGEEIDERNLRAVLDAAGVDVATSRLMALVAAFEGADLEAATERTTPESDADGAGGHSGTDRRAETTDDAGAEGDANPE